MLKAIQLGQQLTKKEMKEVNGGKTAPPTGCQDGGACVTNSDCNSSQTCSTSWSTCVCKTV